MLTSLLLGGGKLQTYIYLVEFFGEQQNLLQNFQDSKFHFVSDELSLLMTHKL